MKLKRLILILGIFVVGIVLGYRQGLHQGSRANKLVNWQYTNVTDVGSWMTDPRTVALVRDGWKIAEVEQEPPWVGGVDRPERTNFRFRRAVTN